MCSGGTQNLGRRTEALGNSKIHFTVKHHNNMPYRRMFSLLLHNCHQPPNQETLSPIHASIHSQSSRNRNKWTSERVKVLQVNYFTKKRPHSGPSSNSTSSVSRTNLQSPESSEMRLTRPFVLQQSTNATLMEFVKSWTQHCIPGSMPNFTHGAV